MSSNSHKRSKTTSKGSKTTLKRSKTRLPSESIQNWMKTLKENKDTILNTKFESKTQYEKFKEFFESITKKVGDELDNNKGPIIEYHLQKDDKEDNKDIVKSMNNIVEKYENLYLKELNEKENNKTEDGKFYPNYIKDLYRKNDNPYIEFEKQNGIKKPIVEQTNEEFLKTLEMRIKGLEICKGTTTQSEYANYFNAEYMNEYTNFDKLGLNKDNMIESQCKSIYYNDNMLNNSKNIITDEKLKKKVLEYYKDWLEKPNEVWFARTFLPEDYFEDEENPDFKTILLEKIKTLILSNNRDIRQFVFGFFEDSEFKYLKNLRPFLFEVGGMLKHKYANISCNPLVNWSIILNMIYSKCSVSNTKVLFPVRFIIPSHVMSKYNHSNSSLNFEIRDRTQITDLFSDKNKFISIITIKYFHEQTKTYRIWFLYVFKNMNYKEELIQAKINTITGLQEEYFIVDSSLKFVNTGSFFERHNMTHTELTFFSELSNRGLIYFYKTRLDNRNIFISTYSNLEENTYLKDNLGITAINIKLVKDITPNINKKYFSKHKFEMSNKKPDIKGGNREDNINKYYKIKTISNDTNIIYSKDEICGEFFNKFYNNTIIILNIYTKNKLSREKFFKIINYLNNYYLLNIEYDFSHLRLTTEIRNKITIYKPISGITFYNNYEILNKFNILNYINKSSKVLYLGTDYSFIEVLKYNNYKVNNITCIITISTSYFINNTIKIWKKYINNIKKVYKTNVLYYNKKLYDLLNLEDLKNNRYNLLYYDVYTMYTPVENYNNLSNIFMGLIIGLKHTEIGGMFIINFGSVAYKNTADIYVIISGYFKNHNLYYPEISNLYKKRGTYGIFTGFEGISDIRFVELLKLLVKTNELYPNDGKDFNIYDEKLRKELMITKVINPELGKQVNIVGYLDDKLLKENKIYEYIRDFNNDRYYKQLNFTYKILDLLNKPDDYINNLELPRPEQLTNAILYCKKYDIPYIDKFSSQKFQDKFGKQILHEAYGLHQAIIYKFKTPYTLKIKQSVSLKKLSKSLSRKVKRSKKSSIRFTKLIDNNNNNNDDMSLDLFLKKNTKKKSLKQQYIKNVNLIPELYPINNMIEQTTKLIDSRRNFDEPEEDKQNVKWFEANKRFRYYKHKSDKEKLHLDKKVQQLLGDYSISQAWLKMYEIITDCELIPIHRKGTYKSFHICEAPGTFINCINNYIYTKTKYDLFEWKAQSLRPNNFKNKSVAFGDDFGLIKRHKNKWDWGVDGSGDITNIMNIKYYKKVVNNMRGVELMTSDCGLPMKSEGYTKVAFASFLTILECLPKGGTMVYKILTPIDEPLILNLIYIAYTNFKELIFYKPVQNSWSREFYIVGKGYLGTEYIVLEKFFNELVKLKESEEIDLYNDIYPEAFVRQMVKASSILADNFIYTIERQIYFVDNQDIITKDLVELFYNYYNEKNEDWIKKYKPIKLNKQFIL